MNFWMGLLIGVLSGLVVVPIGFIIYIVIKNTLERRKIKRLVAENKMLQPIDKGDFDSEMWKEQIKINPEDKEKLDERIFKKFKQEEEPEKVLTDDNS